MLIGKDETGKKMARMTTRPTTAACTLPMYAGFLISEPKSISCTHLSTVMNISHDSINRFLLRENYDAKDLFAESIKQLVANGGTLSVDDTVLDKPYSSKMALVDYFWSGKHHKSVKGLNLITLYYTDVHGLGLPVNYRIYDKKEGKTKNDYFREMLNEVIEWGLRPSFVTGDNWYSCEQNLKEIKDHRLGFMFAVKSNRTVSLEKGKYQQVQTVDASENGKVVWLKDFGHVRLYQQQFKDEQRYYIVYQPEDSSANFSQYEFKKLHGIHWKIEQYHRDIKQICNIEKFQVRTAGAILNHTFAALLGYVELQKMQFNQLISNVYQWKRSLFLSIVKDFLVTFIVDKEHLKPQRQPFVNA